MHSKEYWALRAIEREQEAYLRGGQLSARMFKEYQAAARSIRREVNDFYMRYAGKQGLTYEQAVHTLNRPEAQEWKASLDAYVKKIAAAPDARVKARLTAELDALSYNSSITRLEALNGQIDLILNDLYDKGVRQMTAEFGDGFTQSYYKKCFDLQSRAGYINEIAKITPHMVENIISYPWSGAMFSDRLWKNKQALLFNVREITTQGVIQGQSIASMSKKLADKLGQSYRSAERLIMTETSHFHAVADIKAYEAAGIKEYEFMATLNEKTCPTCGALDGQVFKVEDAQPGININPMHPNCFCSNVAYDPEDAADWLNSGLEMPENMKYKEWYDQQTAEHGPGWVERERKKSYNETADRKQYENYTERLGKNAPESFELFQKMKYNGTQEYNQFKSYARGIRSGELSALADFDLYKTTSLNIDALIGVKTLEGTIITGKSDHFIARVIGSEDQRRSGVTIDSVKDALLKPEKVDSTIRQKGISVRYFGKEAIVTVNPETGNLIQTNPRRSQKG